MMVKFFLRFSLKIPRSQPVLTGVGGACSVKPEPPSFLSKTSTAASWSSWVCQALASRALSWGLS